MKSLRMMERKVRRNHALYARLRAIAMSDERTRLDIIKDLIVADLTRCKPVSEQRKTAQLTQVLFHDALTQADTTVTMPTIVERRTS